jgi:hypothetical protein
MVAEDPHLRQDGSVTDYRVAEAAELLGVSDDTVRRWGEAGRVASLLRYGLTVIAGVDRASLA